MLSRCTAWHTVLICWLLLAGMWIPGCSRADQLPALDEEQLRWIADQIFQNECNRQVPCLTSWNVGEDFPSLGIGHFIWYRAGQQERFVESFPQLLAHYVAQGVELPGWVSGLPECAAPWSDRESFLAARDGAELSELRQFLFDTRHIQADFIVRRMQDSLPALMGASSRPEDIAGLFYQLANTHPPYGMYALIDYVNFKGEGTSPNERYRGEGWGLLQVLEYMLDHPADSSLLQRFAVAARHVLARRIENSPPERQEERWRNGWNNRTRSYVP